MKTLVVRLNGTLIGMLSQTEHGKLSFQYDSGWLAAPQSHPVSQSLPLRTEPFSESECGGFFGGLLPEDYNRELIARNLGITSRNDYAMLREIGGECAGAITLLDPAVQPEELPHAYHPVSISELKEILQTLPRKPLLAGEAEVRLSLAGAQNKLALLHDENGYAVPLHESPSSHILKPESEHFPGLVENEAYCLHLARRADLPAVSAQALQIGSYRCLLVERYDRRRESGQLYRLHQEDFCQAMGIPSRYKYQAEGGPSLAQCFDLLRKASSRPARDLVTLFETVLFNYLIGNNDAHGKNFSLLYSAGTDTAIQLAPLYDLVCTAAYPNLSPKMAMKIGSEYVSAELRLRHWESCWQAIGFSPKQALAQTRRFVEKMETVLGDSSGSDMEESIRKIVRRRLQALYQLLK
jgi:serine/threonine-protein kinase HipA